VVWGVTNEQFLDIGSRTVIEGDPSWSGPLAGEALKLEGFHILGPGIRSRIPQKVFDDELMLLELAIGDEKIAKMTGMMTKFRAMAGRGSVPA